MSAAVGEAAPCLPANDAATPRLAAMAGCTSLRASPDLHCTPQQCEMFSAFEARQPMPGKTSPRCVTRCSSGHDSASGIQKVVLVASTKEERCPKCGGGRDTGAETRDARILKRGGFLSPSHSCWTPSFIHKVSHHSYVGPSPTLASH